MFKLNLDDVIAKATEYYNAGKLLAQHPDPVMRRCINSVGEYRCAVAACYPEELLNNFQGTIEFGIRHKYLELPDDILDFAHIIRIQQAHDFWALFAKEEPDSSITQRLEKIFLHCLRRPTT